MVQEVIEIWVPDLTGQKQILLLQTSDGHGVRLDAVDERLLLAWRRRLVREIHDRVRDRGCEEACLAFGGYLGEEVGEFWSESRGEKAIGFVEHLRPCQHPDSGPDHATRKKRHDNNDEDDDTHQSSDSAQLALADPITPQQITQASGCSHDDMRSLLQLPRLRHHVQPAHDGGGRQSERLADDDELLGDLKSELSA
jgi:hypothetical protein